MKLTAITGQDMDARLVGLEQCPAYWLGRASVRLEEARMWFPVSQQTSARHAHIAMEYRENAARLS